MTSPSPRYADGPAIAAARRAQRLTQYDLAEIVGVSQVQISHIESGRRDAGIGLLSKLCDALHVDRGPFLRSDTDAKAAAFPATVKAAAA